MLAFHGVVVRMKCNVVCKVLTCVWSVVMLSIITSCRSGVEGEARVIVIVKEANVFIWQDRRIQKHLKVKAESIDY